jgi:hypothetical protein
MFRSRCLHTWTVGQRYRYGRREVVEVLLPVVIVLAAVTIAAEQIRQSSSLIEKTTDHKC